MPFRSNEGESLKSDKTPFKISLSKRYKRYKKTEILSQGSHGTCYLALDTETYELVVLKKIHFIVNFQPIFRFLNQKQDRSVPPHALREITILRELKHPNIVELRDFVISPEKFH